ncbi:hypothetical protein HJFPF1_10942 [Paramyrothecium foliicola]|nr:hypothetical protein HJFPF1_10942 [Paramyrothecium foliicola]
MDEQAKRRRLELGFRHVPARDQPDTDSSKKNQRATGTDDHKNARHGPNRKSFSKPKSAPWTVSISQDDLKKLIRGFSPRDMDDKWLVHAVGPDHRGDYVVSFIRSWTSYPVVAIKIHAEFNDSRRWKVGSRPKIVEMIWEEDTEKWNPGGDDPKAEAKETVTNLCRGLVDVHLSG